MAATHVQTSFLYLLSVQDSAYTDGIAKDVFLKDATGKPYVGQVVLNSQPALTTVVRIEAARLHWVTENQQHVFSKKVWPGAVHYPDFAHPAVQEWWTTHLRVSLASSLALALSSQVVARLHCCQGLSCSCTA